MDRQKAKEKGKYVDKLDPESSTRYLDKLSLVNRFDPYELDSEWSTNFDLIPPMDFPGLMNYLIYGVSVYTLKQFRAYKSLEAHMTDGWVHDLKMFVPENCDNTVIQAEVRTKFNPTPVDLHWQYSRFVVVAMI